MWETVKLHLNVYVWTAVVLSCLWHIEQIILSDQMLTLRCQLLQTIRHMDIHNITSMVRMIGWGFSGIG